MKDLIIHPFTLECLENMSASPPQATILVGPAGGGKRTLAVTLAEDILGLEPGGIADYPYKMLIADVDGKAIGIETIREVERFLSLKVPAGAAYNRPVIIENAHLLSLEAQNALLKTLEEPPPGTFIIMTARSEHALLPTIRSRSRLLDIKRPEKAAVQQYFKKRGADEGAVGQAYAISGGWPGLLRALLDHNDHPLLQATEYARRLLSQTAYDRLLAVDELSKQRQLATDVTFILRQMAHVSLQSATGKAAAKWQKVLDASYRAAESLAANGQPKLVLTDLMLSF